MNDIVNASFQYKLGDCRSKLAKKYIIKVYLYGNVIVKTKAVRLRINNLRLNALKRSPTVHVFLAF